MEGPQNTVAQPLEYSTLRRRWPWKPYALGVLTLPTFYFLLYLILRFAGAFHAYYSQGSWEIEGTGIYIVDVPFLPLLLMEGDVQNHLRWLKEPTGS
jgi:hypothetical protein